jgi:hypothetical protein
MKRWWQSKTMWAQIATALIGGLEAAQAVQVVPTGYEGHLFVALAVLNAGLRLVTKEPVR